MIRTLFLAIILAALLCGTGLAETDMTALGTLGGDSRAFAVNLSGQVVGRSYLSPDLFHSVLWENEIPIDLNIK